MKTITKLGLSLLLIAISFSCSEDDEMNTVTENAAYTVIRFGEEQTIAENEGQKEIIIPFDKAAHSSGQIDLKLITGGAIMFQTIPEMIDGVISLQVNEGDPFASFTIIPINDEIVSNFSSLIFSINSLSEGFRKGNNNNLNVGILDDELSGMPRSYIINTDNGSVMQEYFYNAEMKLLKIENTFLNSWDWKEISTFYYSEDSRLSKMTSTSKYDGMEAENATETFYFWENDLITRSERIVDGIKTAYTIYEYDNNKNISKKTDYNLHSPEEYKLSYIYIYKYNEEGNLIEESSSFHYEGNVESKIILTYENYSSHLNPFPIKNIIPGISVQKNLPGIMKYDAGDGISIYNYTYEFDEEGKVIKRITPYETAIFAYH
ncbi:hypothetical protein [Christiangramia sediminis]|uniref:DUF4595 domain-containing protein n=1 Tax=Christiangramia sediminis TaxID=2881336 RepID=A0A9X1LI20_9FLAO|nr:hypothetical protein [Christiangramia sediminis]MCB7480767.1 hypothetical protein [Christiangramia sediminis]